MEACNCNGKKAVGVREPGLTSRALHLTPACSHSVLGSGPWTAEGGGDFSTAWTLRQGPCGPESAVYTEASRQHKKLLK